jgi:tetratricopeptide (TPR) repeat protein
VESLALAARSASNVAARAAATEARFLAWRQGRDAGMARARHAAQINPRDAFLVRLVESIDREARRCLARRDERAASLRYAEWLSIFPDSPEAHYGAGQADRRLGRKDTAYWHLVRATATEPQRLEYRLALAEAAWEAGEQKESIRQYRLGLAQQPDHAAALNNLAVILSRIEPPLRDLKEAVILSERACALTRWKDVRFTRTLVGLYLQSGRAVDAVKLQRQLERAGSGDK